jgi:pseudaminic acid cytidylyltransferase
MKVAVIPARGGSKRIPRKNVRPFAGRPMIAYAIEAARMCGAFAHVIVSTDDDEIAAVALAHGAELPFRRPPGLADDHTGTVPVVAHAITELRHLGWAVDCACCIYPAVPMLQAADLLSALAMWNQGRADYVFPVVPFESPIQRALRRSPSGETQPFQPEHVGTRTQDLEPAFHDAGQFYVGAAEAWLAGRVLHRHARTIVLPTWRVVDIDTPEDWQRAEILFHALRTGQQPV